ncbi:MAG: WYL domain-containing protein [Bacteroidota bacterium]
MSINKKAQIRYLTIDKCLRNKGRLWTWFDLLEAVNEVLSEEINPKTKTPMKIGKTQLFEDLKDLEYRVYNSPIKKEIKGKTTYYSYEDPNYSIQNAPMNETEISHLKQTIQVLSRFAGLQGFEIINEIIPALESKFGLIKVEKPIISYESNLFYEGSKFITPLFNAIVNKRSLSVQYQDFKSSLPYNISFHPYYLKQFNNRWFVFGYNEYNQNAFWNMALDRIKSVEETKIAYVETDVDWEEYFDDFIGVTKINNEVIVEIKLWFSPSQAPYIVTKPIHPSQIIRNTEDGLEVTIKVIPNYELEKLILSFGDTVKVISPESFQHRISKRIQESAKLY